MKAANVADYRELARRRVPKVLFDYIDGGSYAEATLRANSADFEKVRLRQRVLVDVSNISTEVELLGQTLSMPMVLSPVGMAGMYARRGEVQAARAAREAGVPMCLSTMSICDLEEVAKGCGQPIWFQLYMLNDRGYMKSLLERAAALGCPVLAFTVDLPVPGTRYRDIRNGLAGGLGWTLPFRRAWDGMTHPAWVWDVWLNGRPHIFGNIAPAVPQARGVGQFWPWVRGSMNNTLTWSHLDWIRENYPGKIILKGVQDVEDARQAVRQGFDGLVVSNHGGRQLDGAQSSICALPPIADAVGDQTAVLMDAPAIRPTLFELGERLASHGYYVLLPDLFYRDGPYEPLTDFGKVFADEEARKKIFAKMGKATNPDAARSDMQAFLDFLGAQPDALHGKVGVTGYCMGGGLALRAAAAFPDRVAAAGAFHPGNLATDDPHSPHLLADRIKARVYVGGADEDANFPAEQRERLAKALNDAGVKHKVELYEGARHGYVMPDTPVYNEPAAERHWRDLLAMLEDTLKAAG